MKNRSYKRGSREVRQVGGAWQCRMICPKGTSEIPVITVDSRDVAFAWLDGNRELKFPFVPPSAYERKLMKTAPGHALAARRRHLERNILSGRKHRSSTPAKG